MMRRWTILAVALVLATVAVRSSADEADDVQDMVFFHSARPVFLRLRVRLGDRTYQSAWREAVAHLFRNLDVDHDGEVTSKELNRGGWLDRMRKDAGGRSSADVRTLPSPDALAKALHPLLAPVAIQKLPPRPDGAENLFGRLDRDGDRKLSQSELDAAGSALGAYDEDDDGTISASELATYQSRFNGRGAGAPGPVDPNSPIALVIRHQPNTRLVARLIERYDVASRENPRAKDHKLARFELGIGEGPFREADADADGALDAEELSRYLDQPAPDVEITARIGLGKGSSARIEVATPRELPAFLSATLRRPAPGRLDLFDHRLQIELSPRSLVEGGDFDVRKFYKNNFLFGDSDANGMLDKKESERSGVFRENFDASDRNADGKLTEAEALGFVDQQLAIAYGRVLLWSTDEGHALFDALDANHDRRLAARELHTALSRLSAWDLDGDGELAETEIPQHLRLTFDHALPPLLVRFGLNASEEEPRGTGDGPPWFAKMDLNHDGDISPREFLGPLGAFRRLDRDGDGLIDAREAALHSSP